MRTTIGDIAPALLEDWFRERYFTARLDISSSGVENYSLGDLRRLLDVRTEDLDAIVFRDSPSTGADRLTAAVREHVGPGSSSQVMITHGSSEAIFLAMSALLRPGDEVIVPSPAYQSLTSTVEALGASTVPWELAPSAGFVPDLNRLRELLTPHTRMVVANFPHNPTGATLDPAGYRELTGLMDAHPAYLLWDGSLTMLAYEGGPLPDPSTMLVRCVSTGTFSKAYGLPGLRIGWCIAPPDVVARMVRLRDYTTLNSSPLTEHLAAAALQRADVLLGPRLRQAEANRRLLLDWAAAHPDLVDCPAPRGGVTAFARLRRIGDTRPLCDWLAEERQVLVVPGDCFGHPDRIRIGFGGPTQELADGLAELAGAAETATSAAN